MLQGRQGPPGPPGPKGRIKELVSGGLVLEVQEQFHVILFNKIIIAFLVLEHDPRISHVTLFTLR